MVFNSSAWKNSLNLIVDGTLISGTLIDFPLLILLSSGTGITGLDVTTVFDELGPNSKKIAITSTVSGVETELYVEIDKWDSLAEEATLWTKVPTISSGIDLGLNLYYDNTQTTNSGYIGYTGEVAAKQVWTGNNYFAVYHLSQDPSGGSNCILDSTSNGNHGTPEGSMTITDSVSSLTGSGIEFNGSTDYITLPESMIDNLTGLTLESIVYAEYKAENTIIVSDAVHWTDDISLSQMLSPQSSYISTCGVYESTGVYTRLIDTDIDFNSTEYNYLAVTFTASDYVRIYRNGVEKDKSTTSVSYIKNEDNTLYIGRSGYGAGNHYIGIMDEIRFSNIERQPAWLATTNHSIFNQLITFSIGPSLVTTYYFNGYVKLRNHPVIRQVNLHRRDTGALIGTTTSSGDGYYYIETTHAGPHYLLCLDDAAGEDFNDLVRGNISPYINEEWV